MVVKLTCKLLRLKQLQLIYQILENTVEQRHSPYYCASYFCGRRGDIILSQGFRSCSFCKMLITTAHERPPFFITLVVSTFLCKGSRDHAHTGWERGPHSPHWFNSIWQNPLGREEDGEREGERREWEKEGETCWKRGEGDASGASSSIHGYKVKAFGMLPPPFKEKIYTEKPPVHESGRMSH